VFGFFKLKENEHESSHFCLYFVTNQISEKNHYPYIITSIQIDKIDGIISSYNRDVNVVEIFDIQEYEFETTFLHFSIHRHEFNRQAL